MKIYQKITALETGITLYCNRLGGRKIDAPLSFISSIRFLIIFWFILTLVVIFFDRTNMRNIVLDVLVVAGLHFGITEGFFKYTLTAFLPKRTRPYIINNAIKPVGRQFSDASFPSSHMASTIGMLTIFTAYHPQLLVFALIFALLMAFSRLHNGMHYPSDVIAGTLLGLLYGEIAVRML